MLNDDFFSIINDSDDILESVSFDPFGMNVALEITTSPNLASTVNEKNLKDPAVVAQIKRQLRSAKRWDKVLKVIQKLNSILAGGTLVGGVTKVVHDTRKLNDAITIRSRYGIDDDITTGAFNDARDVVKDLPDEISSTTRCMIVVLLIQTAIAVLTPLVKKAIRNKEITNMALVRGPVEDSIKLYEKQLKEVTSETDKKKLQDAIDRLKDLKETMDDESERLTEKDKPKSDK